MEQDVGVQSVHVGVLNQALFDKRNFLARGGEVYYLHLLQALEKNEENKEKLEKLLLDLMGGENNKLFGGIIWLQKK